MGNPGLLYVHRRRHPSLPQHEPKYTALAARHSGWDRKARDETDGEYAFPAELLHKQHERRKEDNEQAEDQ